MSKRNRLPGMRNIKTLQTVKASGIPRIQLEQTAYLSLYFLEKEKYRLQQESDMHDEKAGILNSRIDVIKNKMELHHKSLDLIKNDRRERQDRSSSLGLMQIRY